MARNTNSEPNLQIHKAIHEIPYPEAIESIVKRLDRERGLVFSSNVEFPGRYTCWDIGLINPPIAINAWGLAFCIEALNARGNLLLHYLYQRLPHDLLEGLTFKDNQLKGKIKHTEKYFTEEMRSKQPSIFSILREVIKSFQSGDDAYLGLYGAFGYDLAFQFEPIERQIQRDPNQRDLSLYLPDEIYAVDHRRETAVIHRYDFSFDHQSTKGLPRDGEKIPFKTNQPCKKSRSLPAGEYASLVEKAKTYFKRGDLFEVVPGQSFYQTCQHTPAQLFDYLREINPSPYSFLFNLGEEEYLVGISPEMFVRVTDRHVETRPISGTIKRGNDPLEDSDNLLTLLNSKKDEAELTMCTDVDRNDKSRICVPGSVKLTSRREIEKYSKLFHTVDHVEGTLAPEFDAIDAFLSHAWAVTLTGAPKKAAMQFIENHESTPRNWYGGAIGWLTCQGNMNTGITIRTIQIKKGIAEVRAGSTLLYDSNPIDEEKETELKASAMLQVLRHGPNKKTAKKSVDSPKFKKRILLIDHEDSFVNTLANYFRQCGATVTTVRADFPEQLIDEFKPELIVLSPGPGTPKQFNLAKNIERALNHQIPLFGVCLGLQGIAEYFGAQLKELPYPMHGKKTVININDGKLFKGLPTRFHVGRYHSLYIDQATVPTDLHACAITEDGVVMAIEHRKLPIAAVQFHPESIMTLDDHIGMKIIHNALSWLTH